MEISEFRDIKKSQKPGDFAAQEVTSGIPIPAVQRVRLFSSSDWEEFVEEWAHSLKNTYSKIQRYAGSGDKGCDVVGFINDTGFKGIWDNYQCKHYDHSLSPSDVWLEIGKIIYYSYIGEYKSPRKYYFAAPMDIGLKLKKLLQDPSSIKSCLIENWTNHCQDKITSTCQIFLDEALLAHIESFDFSTFSSLSVVDLINGHSKTQFYATRFGGGLAQRPPAASPPLEIHDTESRYIKQLMEAYSDHLQETINQVASIISRPDIGKHFSRARENFYHAESLRNFARDTVPEGTFEALQDEVYHGVIDICESFHADGFIRAKATVSKAGDLSLTSNALCTKIKIQDKHGICHQLSNDDRLAWVRKKNG
ncbi:MAG: hypothetical protein IPK63_10675 [Candidatus Competibacteraceae bacterium]|nr:hypothetical protein [Candidatus Competibacteraceae bacterium]